MARDLLRPLQYFYFDEVNISTYKLPDSGSSMIVGRSE
jgi:hypothetical protein